MLRMVPLPETSSGRNGGGEKVGRPGIMLVGQRHQRQARPATLVGAFGLDASAVVGVASAGIFAPGRIARTSPGASTLTDISAAAPSISLADVQPRDQERMATGIGELDRALGGGLVAGQVALLGGDPGIGKSTLLLQVAARLAATGRDVIYVSGEESAEQVRLRAVRLGLGSAPVASSGEK